MQRRDPGLKRIRQANAIVSRFLRQFRTIGWNQDIREHEHLLFPEGNSILCGGNNASKVLI